MYLVDTNIVVDLRDGVGDMAYRVGGLASRPHISLLTWVELEGGVHKVPELAGARRRAVDALLGLLNVLAIDAPIVREYGAILKVCGFSRPRILDRLIAATAIVHDLTLITMNPGDFQDIPKLALEIWQPAPQ